MALVAAKCTNCGANLQIEHTKDAGICSHCGTAFITEKAINNYNITNVNYNTQNVVKNIYGRERTEAEEYIKNGDIFIKLDNYKEAKEQYILAVKSDPADWRGWFGLVKYETQNFTKFSDIIMGTQVFITSHLSYLEKAKAVASAEELQTIDKLYKPYARRTAIVEKGYLKSPGGVLLADLSPNCPFCGKEADWFQKTAPFGGTFYVCAECFAEIKVAFSLFTNKIKSVEIISAGRININNLKAGRYDPQLLFKDYSK